MSSPRPAAIRLFGHYFPQLWPQRLRWQRLLLLAVDACILAVALLAAVWLRFAPAVAPGHLALCRSVAALAVPFMAVCFLVSGLYNRVWEYAGMDAAIAVVAATIATVLAGYLAATAVLGSTFPASIWIIWWLLLTAAVGGSRLAWRVLRRHLYPCSPPASRKRLLIYGAGEAGQTLVAQVAADRYSPYEIVGLVDDDPRRRGVLVRGKTVLGTAADLPRIVRKHEVDEIIIAAPSASPSQRSRMLHNCSGLNVPVRILPRLLDMIDHPPLLHGVRNVRAAELLGRDSRIPSLTLQDNYIRGNTVLVTGAGGSIGSEICRRVCAHGPRKVVLFGRGENRIHAIYKELSTSYPDIELVPCIGNFTDYGSCASAFSAHRPQIVVHAGAHKHVYLMEANPVEAVRNNVLGTEHVASCAEACGCRHFLFISTDKAADPCNVMGATKRFCELRIQQRARHAATCYSIVRFGNVIGSDGSVLRTFEEQLAAGQPLTITHPEADRYFMTIPEAAFLVLQSAVLGASGDIFVLDMGEPVRILDLAYTLLSLYGRDPYAPGAVTFTGLQPGEKLHETLTNSFEQLVPTSCPWVWKVQTSTHFSLNDGLDHYVALMQKLVADHDAERLRRALFQAVADEVALQQAAR